MLQKSIFRLFAIIAIAGLAFTGCQKEENLLEPENNIEEQIISFWDAHPELAYLKKKENYVDRMPDVKDTIVKINGQSLKSTTIRNQIWTNADNESVDLFFGQEYSGGVYFLKPDVTALDGFHIPIETDIALLVKNLNGYVARIPLYLNLSAGGMVSYDGVNYTPENSIGTAFWSNSTVTTPNPPYNIYERISLNNGLSYAQTSKFYALKVRLVKNL